MTELRDLRNYFIFDGVPSTDFDVFCNGKDTFSAPSASIDRITVPGKSGDLLRFNNRYENIEVSYDSWIADDMRLNLRALRSYLLSKTTYCRLEDTYHPDEYRMAVYSGGLEATASFENQVANFTLKFNCKPQRYLKEGETPIILSGGSMSLTNPSYLPSTPNIRIRGNGTLVIGSFTITTKNNSGRYIDMDCELMDAHTGSTNRNSDVVTNTDGFITIPPGKTWVTKDSTITSVEIIPRWYFL